MLVGYYRDTAVLFVVIGMFVIVGTYFLSYVRESPIWNSWNRFFYQAALCTLPLYCFIASLRTNILWNGSLKCSLQTEEQECNDSKMCYSNVAIKLSYFTAIASLIFAFLPASIYYIFFFSGDAVLMPYVNPIILVFAVSFLFCFHKFIALPLVRDESSLLRSPPKIKDIHSVLVGEKKISGFNGRVYFWGDTAWIWTACIFVQGIVYRDYFVESDRPFIVYPVSLVFLLSFLVPVLFTLFFGGIPRKRYWGFILVAASLLIMNVFSSILMEYFQVIMPPDSLKAPHALFLFRTGFPLSILSGMMAAGISGLLVFKQK